MHDIVNGVADGLECDHLGRLYTTNFEHDSILRRETDGSYCVMVRDPRIVWPDGLSATRQHLYCTLGQWNRLASFNGGHDLRRPPYLLIRILLEGPQTLNAFGPEAPNSPDPISKDLRRDLTHS